MSYRLVKGMFHLFYQGSRHVGARPDGDSLWFGPDDPNLLDGLDGRDAELNGGGFAQLRLEGLDALELHYQGSNHQLEPPTVSARDTLLGLAGFTSVTYAPNDDIPSSVRGASPHPRTGYILTKAIDPFGRPVAFAFGGSTSRADGGDVWLDTALLDNSLNAELMRQGEVYPAYYTGLPWDLRNHLTDLAVSAFNSNAGLWADDSSASGSSIAGFSDLTDLAIWPKLYRRLLAFFKDGNTSVSQFDTWLRADPDRDDDLWIMSLSTTANMHDIVTVAGNTLTMEYEPEDLIIVPR